VSLANNRSQQNNQLTKRIENKMTITYTLWQGSQLLAVNQKASKPEEILAVIKELEKLGKGFTYNIREVEVK
jgi:4-hydroxy-3-methylbut-2-enyl diphosphate reductase IspH